MDKKDYYINSPVAWFCLLERERERGNFERAAEAKRELKRLGLTIRYRGKADKEFEKQTPEPGEVALFENLCNARKNDNIIGIFKSNRKLNEAGVTVQFAEVSGDG
ncbi:MAG: hypothetical protein FVQ84_09220 [Planctomycetes bacterium]|nr:hypothetical protein [Planctomycetota bacterium]